MNYFAYINEFNITIFDVGVVMIPVLHMRTLMCREVKRRTVSKVN